MQLADLKSSVLLTLLTVFAAGWLALYFIMANRVTAAEATAITLNGQQSTALQEINNQLATMNRTLGQIEERSRQQSITLDDLRDEIRQLTAAVAADK